MAEKPEAKMPAPQKKPKPTAPKSGRFRLVLAVLLGLALGRFVCAPSPDVGTDGSSLPVAETTIWTCAMHPQIRLPEPGQCPICGMDLVKASGSGDEDGLDPNMLSMSANAAALASIQTIPVRRQSVAHEVRMVGRVAHDETRLSYITAWVPGRLDRMFVDYTGVTVREGDHMVELYSPEIIATQQELLQAVLTEKLLRNSPVSVVQSRQAASVESARERLRLWGLERWQIDEIVQQGSPSERVTINAPGSGIVIHKNALQGDWVKTGTRIYTIADLTSVWVVLDAYESDLSWLHYGQEVQFVTEAYPGERFTGRISFIDPVLNDRTRTVNIRVNVPNQDLRLKPDMFVRATVSVAMTTGGRLVDPALANLWMCPMHPEVVSDGPGACNLCGMDLVPTAELGFHAAAAPEELPLAVPASAPLLTGKRAVVYVKVPGTARPTFRGQEVVLGPRAGDWYVVREGLEEGDEVVIQGAFKIDSELQIRARPSMMNPEGGGPPPGHHHGGAPPATAPARREPEPDGQARPQAAADIPVEFRSQLGSVTSAYLETSEALSADDATAASTAAAAMTRLLDEVDMSLLTGDSHMTWMRQRTRLIQAAKGIASSDDLEAQRLAFGDLSKSLIDGLERFGHATAAGQLSVFHCPMAFKGKGADWIQANDQTANPYLGSSMLRCGDVIRTIPQEP